MTNVLPHKPNAAPPFRGLAARLASTATMWSLAGAREMPSAGEEAYRHLFNSIDQGFCVLDMVFDPAGRAVDYVFLEVNPAFEKQSGMGDVVGKRMRQMRPDHEQVWFDTFGKVALTGEAIRMQGEGKALHRWFDVYAFRIGGAQSRKVAVMFSNIYEEIQTQRKLREQAQALVDADKRKDEFLAVLCHELRTPLASLSNAAHLLELRRSEDPVRLKAQAVIRRQIGQLSYLIDDLLEVSRIATGKIRLRRERIALADLVKRALETAQPLVQQRRHLLSLSAPESPVWVDVDGARLEQVIVNLLNNAAKYTHEGGHITLAFQAEGEAAVLRVSDNGVGIAPELLPRIFDMFTQAEGLRDHSQGGLGIGLCLAQRLVELHSGTVEATSTVGVGSQFVVRLPLAAAQGTA